MTNPSSPALYIIPPGEIRRGGRRVSTAALQDLEEPRPAGGWNTLERFASSYQRSATFSLLDTASPGSSFGVFGSYRPGIPDFGDDAAASAAIEDDEETSLMSSAGTPYGVSRRSSHRRGSQDIGDTSGMLFGHTISKPGDEIYGTIGRRSRRPSLLTEPGGPELLIKEIQDEAGNVIEVVVGQVLNHFNTRKLTMYRAQNHRLSSIRSTSLLE
jgi:hypothetical protein